MSKDIPGTQETIEGSVLPELQRSGGRWAVYINSDETSPLHGHFQYLRYGDGQTYRRPPDRMPDNSKLRGAGYVFLGYANLETGKIQQEEPCQPSTVNQVQRVK